MKRQLINRDETLSVYVRDLQREINGWLSHFGLPIQADFSEYTAGGFFSQTDSFKRDEEARLYSPSVEAAMQCIAYFAQDIPYVYLCGLMQMAKSPTQAMTYWLSPVINYLLESKHITVPFAVTPGSNGLYNQYRGKLTAVFKYLKFAKFTNINTGVSVEVSKYHQHFYGELCSEPGLENLRNTGGVPGIILPVRRGLTSKALSVVKNFIHKNPGYRFLFVQDEAHAWGDGNSVQDNMMTKNALYDDLGTRAQILRCSATPYDMIGNKAKAKIVKLPVDSGYIGFNIDPLNPNELYTKEVEIRSPEIYSVNDMAKYIGKKHIYWLDSWRAKQAFETGKNFDSVCQAVAALSRYLLLQDNRGKGMVLRTCNINSAAKELSSYLGLMLQKDDIIVINYYGDDKENKSLSDRIKEEIGDSGKKYIVIVTNKCRMGDSLPKDCCYGASLTTKSASIESLLQEIVGRVGGYKDVAVLVLSEENKQMLLDYVAYRLPLSRMSNKVKGGVRENLVIDRQDGVVARKMIDRVWNLRNKNGQFGKGSPILFTPYEQEAIKMIARRKGYDEVSVGSELYASLRTNTEASRHGGGSFSDGIVVRCDPEKTFALSIELPAKQSVRLVSDGVTSKLNRLVA